MGAKLSSLLRSKKGLVGAAVFLYGAIYTLLTALQDVTFVAEYVSPALSFLDTGVGNALILVLGIVLLLWAIHSQDYQDKSSGTIPAAEPGTGSEQLRAKLQESEQKRQRLEKELEEAQYIGIQSSANLGVKPGNPSAVIERLQAELEQVRAERDALKNQPGDEELKQRSLHLSDGIDPAPRTPEH